MFLATGSSALLRLWGIHQQQSSYGTVWTPVVFLTTLCVTVPWQVRQAIKKNPKNPQHYNRISTSRQVYNNIPFRYAGTLYPHKPQHFMSMWNAKNDKKRMLKLWSRSVSSTQSSWTIMSEPKGKGYPNRAVFEARVDTCPLHSLGLTVEHQQQADGLRLTERRQEERQEAKRRYEEDFRCDVDAKLLMNAEDMSDRHCCCHYDMHVDCVVNI